MYYMSKCFIESYIRVLDKNIGKWHVMKKWGFMLCVRLRLWDFGRSWGWGIPSYFCSPYLQRWGDWRQLYSLPIPHFVYLAFIPGF